MKQYEESKNIGNELVNLKSETTYTEASNITTSPPQFLSEDYFDTKLQAMFNQSDQIFEKQHEEFNLLRGI